MRCNISLASLPNGSDERLLGIILEFVDEHGRTAKRELGYKVIGYSFTESGVLAAYLALSAIRVTNRGATTIIYATDLLADILGNHKYQLMWGIDEKVFNKYRQIAVAFPKLYVAQSSQIEPAAATVALKARIHNYDSHADKLQENRVRRD